MKPTEPDELPYICDPTVREVFASHTRCSHFDGQSVFVELLCIRTYPTGPTTTDVKAHTAARLVLSPFAAVGLWQQLGKLVPAMEESGMIRRIAPGSGAKQ